MNSSNTALIHERYQTLNEFNQKWTLNKLNEMTLPEYNSLGNKDSFCYWIEHITDNLGRIKGTQSSKFGIWQMRDAKTSTSVDFLDDGNYKWYRKYGETAEEAFEEVRRVILDIARFAQNEEFDKLDSLEYFSLARWKIAFLYSKNKLFPVYNKIGVRKIARNFDYSNFKNDRISRIHQYLVKQVPSNEDLFEFAFRQYHLTKDETSNNYYIVGSKYRSDSGEYVDISTSFYTRSVISVGFFWNNDLTHLYGKTRIQISKWLDKHLKNKEEKYATAKSALLHFLSLKEGDIVAVKSQGIAGNLTIIAYAEVVSKNGEVYFHDPEDLGHCIHVQFLESDLSIKTGLSYAQTMHRVVPFSRKGHFEKIFGGYSFIELEVDKDIVSEKDFELSESRINEKQTESRTRNVSYSTTVRNVHNKIQSAFAIHLQKTYPDDTIRTEERYIDIVRQTDTELFFYEVKPYSRAYSCIREAIGQLLDYYHSNPSKTKEIHLRVVGPAEIKKSDERFIRFIKENFKISFDYIGFSNF